jgi:hypothetical protein
MDFKSSHKKVIAEFIIEWKLAIASFDDDCIKTNTDQNTLRYLEKIA